MYLAAHLVCPNTPCWTRQEVNPPGSARLLVPQTYSPVIHATSDIEERKPQRTWRIVICPMCSVKCYADSIAKNDSIFEMGKPAGGITASQSHQLRLVGD